MPWIKIKKERENERGTSQCTCQDERNCTYDGEPESEICVRKRDNRESKDCAVGALLVLSAQKSGPRSVLEHFTDSFAGLG